MDILNDLQVNYLHFEHLTNLLIGEKGETLFYFTLFIVHIFQKSITARKEVILRINHFISVYI